MFYRFILLLYGITLLQDVLVDDTSSIQTTTLQKQILEILAPHIISNTSEEICLRIFKIFLAKETCFLKTFPTANNSTDILACLNFNLTMLETLVRNTHDFKTLEDYILISCLYLLPDRMAFTDYPDFIHLLQSLFKIVRAYEISRILLFRLLAVVRNNNSTFTLNDMDFILKAWRPFSSDVIGMIAYNNQTYLDLGINSSQPGIDDKDLDVAFSLKLDFLEKLVEKFCLEEKMTFRVVIVLTKNKEMWELFSDYYSNMLGIDFGGICINNELIMIRIVYRTTYQIMMQKEYSQNDFDPLGCNTLFCSFPMMLFVNLEGEGNFCRPSTTTGNSTTMTWSTAPAYSPMIPARFCLTKDCNIPVDHCWPSRKETSFRPTQECHENYHISNDTQQLYEYFKCCYYDQQYCRIVFDIHGIKSYADAKIYMLLAANILFGTYAANDLYERSGDVFDKGLEFLERENSGIDHLHCMLGDIEILNSVATYADVSPIKNENYVYFTYFLQPTETIGFVSYRNNADVDFSNYHIKYITDKNVSYDYSADDAVEVVIYLQNESRYQFAQYEYIQERIFLIRNSSFMNNATFSCRSRIVVVYQTYFDGTPEFTVYLKTVEDGSQYLNMFRREGYWFTIIPSVERAIAFCVSELTGNVCNTVKQVMIYSFTSNFFEPNRILTGTSPETNIWNRTVTPLHMLSQLAISINPRMKWIFQDYFYVFHTVAITESILSALGLFWIFSSAVILKDWCEKKFNTVQLSISLSLEIAFFLIDVDKITHIGYLIFYYSILTQFTWMLIIGYHQYLKFVKVFTSPSINRKKSLIVGWFIPALIMLLPLLIYPECLKCDLCYKNEQIFNYFIIGPVSLVILTNLIIYFAVMYNILRVKGAEISGELRKAKIRAAILFPFLLGISWISIFALLSPWSWISIGGFFVFYIVTPSQGFVLFIFAVLLDKLTVMEWRHKYSNLLAKMVGGKRNHQTEEIELKIA